MPTRISVMIIRRHVPTSVGRPFISIWTYSQISNYHLSYVRCVLHAKRPSVYSAARCNVTLNWPVRNNGHTIYKIQRTNGGEIIIWPLLVGLIELCYAKPDQDTRRAASTFQWVRRVVHSILSSTPIRTQTYKSVS